MRLSQWEVAVKKRRAGILRALRTLKTLHNKTRRARIKSSLDDMMLYGIMNRHRQHWHKINGHWYRNTVRTLRR